MSRNPRREPSYLISLTQQLVHDLETLDHQITALEQKADQ